MEFKIKGMHCESCIELISMELEDMGFKNFNIDLKTELLTIDDTQKVDIEKVEQALKNAGDYEIVI